MEFFIFELLALVLLASNALLFWQVECLRQACRALILASRSTREICVLLDARTIELQQEIYKTK